MMGEDRLAGGTRQLRKGGRSGHGFGEQCVGDSGVSVASEGSTGGVQVRPALPNWRLAFRIPEACAATGYKRSKLYQIIKDGKIAIKKDGSCTLILSAELERYLNSLN